MLRNIEDVIKSSPKTAATEEHKWTGKGTPFGEAQKPLPKIFGKRR